MSIWNWIINLWTLFWNFYGKNQETPQNQRIVFALVYQENKVNNITQPTQNEMEITSLQKKIKS